jgi:AsmA protein
MKKLLKWMIKITVSLIVLIVIAAVVLPLVIDPNDYKDTIENKIQENIGRSAHLDGDIEWKVFPWLALGFNDVKIDNQKGFEGESLAVVNTLSARVKLLPLLTKKIEVGQVILDDAEFNLQVNKNGHSNWKSILDHLQSEDSTASNSETSSNAKLNIAGIKLNNITVNYTDLQAKTQAKISKLNLTTSEISAINPIDIKAYLHVAVADTGLDVDMTTQVTAKNLLGDTGVIIDIDDFSVKGQSSSDNELPIDVSLNEGGVVDLSKDVLNIPSIVMTLGEAELLTNLSGKNITQNNSMLSGSFKLNKMNLNEFLKKLTGAYFVTTDTFDDFQSSGSWVMQGQALKLSKLQINYADTTVTGQANITNLDKLKGQFNLNINKFNVDDFLGTEETAQSTDTSGSNVTPPDINFGQLKGMVNIAELTASGTKVQNLSITVNTNGSKMALEPIKADFYQGLLVSAIKIDTKATKEKVIVEHKMNKVQAGPLLTDLAGSELLTGLGNFDANINIDKPFSDVPLKSAHGNISYTLSDGAIYGVDVFGMMQKGLSLLYPEVKEEAGDGEKKTTFALMEMDADINEGILTSNKLNIESPYLKIKGNLTIDLVKMTIKGTIEPELLDIPEQLVSEKYKKLIGLPIPVSLSGSLLEPNVSIDAKKLILSTQKKKINKEKDKLKKKLLDGLFGG